ncbi:guanylate kinase [Riemerella anatipestifer]|nr:guanylate kinase [Riemerella anatipestifer]
MDKVIIFSAPSGSGKTTLVKYCLEKFSNLEFSISATTRQPRGAEQDGKDYHFLSLEKFKQLISEEAFVEYEEVYMDKFYGTLKSEVERIWKLGNTVIFDVDVVGGVNLKKIFGEKALSIFIAPPSIEELKNRLVSRGTDDEETIKIRVDKAAEELSYQDKFDKIIINDDLSVAQKEVEQVIHQFLN